MDYELIGTSLGQHGPYTFYKAFKYSKNNQSNILALSEFCFVKLWPDSDLISIGELQLLWQDKNTDQTLASLRLYILPENTVDGRNDIHGEDEVLAISDKVVLRVEDLLTWIHVAPDWHWGLGAVWFGDVGPPLDAEDSCDAEPKPHNDEAATTAVPLGLETQPPLYPRHVSMDMDDVLMEKQKLGSDHWESTPGVVVLSYPRYCRYRGLLKRLEGVYNKWLRNNLILALGGFTCPFKNTRIVFCKDTYDYPELEVHELLCNHLAPKLKCKGSRKRKKKEVSASEEEEEEEDEDEDEDEDDKESDSDSDSSLSTGSSSLPPAVKPSSMKPRLRCTLEVGNRVTNSSASIMNLSTGNRSSYSSPDEKKFLQGLHAFMRARHTPIGRIPIVGFKEVNLYKLYRKVIELGGYDVVTNNKMWKLVYQVTGGDMSCTSAATLSRRHYEKLLLPYERFLKNKAASLVMNPSINISQHFRLSSSVKISPLRNVKPVVTVKVERSGEKENTPERVKSMLGSSVTIVKKEPKEEVLDLVASDPAKAVISVKNAGPVVKKQKLDMLKQGGLVVTPVALQAASYSGSDTVEKPVVKKERTAVTPPPSVSPAVGIGKNSKVSVTVTPDISRLNQGDNKVSITVTPDMSHLMYPWSAGSHCSNGPGSSKQKPTNPPPNSSNAVVFSRGSAVGLPVEAVLGGASSPIDLRTTKSKKPNIGSNLEISLVPSGTRRPTAPGRPGAPTHQRVTASSRFNAPIYTLKTNPNAAPYVPLIDPAYLCGNIVTQKLPQFVTPNPATSSPASINAFYKDLLRSQGIFNLLPDGSTSISLVGQSTPTSK